MKKAVYLTVALAAFILGISVFYVHLFYFPISLSELRRNRSRLGCCEIKVVGKLQVVKEGAQYFVNLEDWEDDDCRDNFCFTSLEVSTEVRDENIALINELVDRNRAHQGSNIPEGEYVMDAEVTGRLVERELPLFPGEKTYEIKVEKMKQLSPVRFVASEDITRSP